MIIVEGPDGAGKGNLIKRISTRFGLRVAPRASDSLRGPVDNLCDWVDNDLLNWGSSELKLYDRYPLISEPIYGPICRGTVPEKMVDGWMRSRMNTFRSMSLVIWCLPSLEEVKKNVGNGDHMSGVVENITAIWYSYGCASRTWMGTGMNYDYNHSNPNPRDTQLVSLIRRQINGWRHFS